MAYVAGKSGYFDFQDSNKQFTWRVNWSETYDIALNRSIVQIDSIEIKSFVYGGRWYPHALVLINGEQVAELDYYEPTHVYSADTSAGFKAIKPYSSKGKAFPFVSNSIAHDAEGKKSITISVVNNPAGKNITSIQLYRDSDGTLKTFGAKHEQTIELTAIARASQPSLVTWPETTQNVGNFGEEFSIHMNTASQDFRHTVRYEYGDRSGTIATNVVNGTTWTVPLSFMNDIPNATSASGLIYVDTYSNGTKIGTKYTGFTVSVPASVKPSCSATLDDTMGIDTIYGSPVQGLSKIKVTVTPTQAYSSPIASYSISIDGVKYSSQTATTGFLTKGGDSKVTVTVKDKRGRTSAPWEYTMKVQEYNKPSISYLAVHRCDADGNEDDQGGFVSVNFSAEVYPLKNLNTAMYVLKYKKPSASGWTSVNLPLSNVYTAEDENYVFEADAESSYDVELVVTDRHNSTTRATSVSTAFTLVDWHSSGTGIRFGGVAEDKYTFRNDLTFVQTGNQYCFSSIGAASTDGYILMARITVTAENSDTPISFVLSRRKATAPMTIHVLFNSTANTDPGLASIRYEGDNYDAYLTSPTESVWDLYVKKVSNSDTITLNSWHTSYRQMNRVSLEFIGSIATTVPTGRFGYYKATPAVLPSIIDCILPVGMIIQLYSHADPNDMYPGTTWVRLENAFLWATSSGGTIGQTGGSQTHTHSLEGGDAYAKMGFCWSSAGGNGIGMAITGKTFTSNYTMDGMNAYKTNAISANQTALGGNTESGSTMPPYIQISAWRRTA